MTPQELASTFHTSGLAEADLETLQAFQKVCKAPVGFGRILFPDAPKNSRNTVLLLGCYAGWQVVAMKHRKDGNIQRALHAEASADAIFDKLPGYARW